MLHRFQMSTKTSVITVRNSSCRKVMFSQACVKNPVNGEACMATGYVWQRGVHSRGHVWWGYAWQGACTAGGMCGEGHAWQWGHAWQERRPLQRTVRILLECILVNIGSLFQADLSIFKSIHLFALPAIKLQAECRHNRY